MIAFDDGPCATTGPILDILAAHGATATFFVVGEKIAGQEELLERMRDEGHTIGNHTWSHPRLTELSDAEVTREIERCSDAIEAVSGTRPRLFRPPFVAIDERIFGLAIAAGYTEVFGQPSIGDYDLPASVIAGAFDMDPLWLHDDVPATVEALPAILAARAS